MADDTRIQELERRIARDPASVAFAQLAEEYRRARRYDEAVRLCRDGLSRSPNYPSARLTLGRALAALGEPGEARAEFERLILEGPDHLVALRARDELRRLGTDAPSGGDDSLPALQSWLDSIAADRARRRAAATT